MERTNITQWRKQTLQNGVNKIYTMEQTKFTQWSKQNLRNGAKKKKLYTKEQTFLHNKASNFYTMEKTNCTQWSKQTLHNRANNLSKQLHMKEQTKFTHGGN